MWASPDGNIIKKVVLAGQWGTKPSEQAECKVEFLECPDYLLELRGKIVIGDSDTHLRRLLDICLITMNEREVATFQVSSENLSFTLKLAEVKSKGYIYQWDANFKYETAKIHKEKGVTLYKENQEKDACYRFIKGLKIISSIPIDAEKPPKKIDGVPVAQINKLKATLFNNLASYYLKINSLSLTIETCKKVIALDRDNVKAHYKLALAQMKDRNFESAEVELKHVLQIESNNKAAEDLLKCVREEIREATARSNLMIKKMFA